MLPSLNSLQNLFHSARDALTPTLKSTQFLEQGKLTPEEFVAAGDFLIRLSPTWRWSAATAGLGKSYLPAGKQFLITRGVMCQRRVRDAAGAADAAAENDAGDGWTATGSEPLLRGAGTATAGVEKADSYGDLSAYADSFIDRSVAGFVDSAAAVSFKTDTECTARSYEISITYDNVYRTPRVYLAGFAADAGVPLSPDEMMEDISQDYINKTATIERHPHIAPSAERAVVVSIHPCRHAQTMKRILDTMMDGGDSPGVELYLFIFLKFIASVIPTMEYDLTVPVTVGASRLPGASLIDQRTL